ncbi:MAG TPA: methylenetetrahydrofolate reductase [Pseudolabrys sp.]|nr:methylenetetrahydrofolate reductase [Pseudolabrys sp.]
MPPEAHASDPSGFARQFSLEATRPTPSEIKALAELLPPGTAIYLTAVPTQDTRELIGAAAATRKAALEPVVHVAARRLLDATALQELLAGIRGEADAKRLLVIGGDVDAPGSFVDALAVIQRGGLREAGIEEIGIAGYPEGHPRIPACRIESALDEKIAAATAQGLRVHIVSQFSFSPQSILAWLRQLRAGGITNPVRVGMAGPTSIPALLRYAKRCGVAASLRGLVSGAASGLVGNLGPDRIIRTLSVAGDLGDVAPHYFSFGGTLETARYACEAAAGRYDAARVIARTN